MRGGTEMAGRAFPNSGTFEGYSFVSFFCPDLYCLLILGFPAWCLGLLIAFSGISHAEKLHLPFPYTTDNAVANMTIANSHYYLV